VLSANLNPFKQAIRFRIIPYQLLSGATNMRLDNYFCQIADDKSNPVLRFYGWTPNCISIGYHQDQSIINDIRLGDDGFDMVRRPTGGRAILHARELTYSIVMPSLLMTHQKLYSFTHQLIAKALNDLGYPVKLTSGEKKLPRISHTADDFPCFTRSADTEIQYRGKKVVGSAQKILKSSILQHGSILIGSDHKQLIHYLRVTGQQIEKIKSELEQKTICLADIKKEPLTPEKIMTRVVNLLESVETFSVYFQELEEQEFTASKGYEI
jgi:lipoyl(octanoyl) transferase